MCKYSMARVQLRACNVSSFGFPAFLTFLSPFGRLGWRIRTLQYYTQYTSNLIFFPRGVWSFGKIGRPYDTFLTVAGVRALHDLHCAHSSDCQVIIVAPPDLNKTPHLQERNYITGISLVPFRTLCGPLYSRAWWTPQIKVRLKRNLLSATSHAVWKG